MFTWEVTTFSSDFMTLKLNYEFLDQISNDLEGKDKVTIKVIDEVFFLSESSRLPILKDTQLESDLPRQLHPSLAG